MEFIVSKNVERKSGVYRITSDHDFHKIYIGSGRDLKMRFWNHKSQLKRNVHRNKHLQRQFNKYNDLTFELLGLCPEDDLLELEQLILDEYKLIKEVFNVSVRCDRSHLGMKHSDEARRKMSERLKGKPRFDLRGRKATPEQIQKMRERLLGKPSPIKGIPRKDWHIEAIKKGLSKMTSEEKQQQGDKRSPKIKKYWSENKENHIANRLKNKPQYKWIIQCDMNGNTIQEIHGVKEAAKLVGVQPSRITDCLKGRRKHTHGFTFKYK